MQYHDSQQLNHISTHALQIIMPATAEDTIIIIIIIIIIIVISACQINKEKVAQLTYSHAYL